MGTPIKTEAGNLKGRTVVITGGSSGIGLATAQMIVGRGGRVVLIGRTAEKLEQASERLGAGVSTIALDVTDDVALARAFVDIGPFDHLVTAAAGTLRGRMVDLDTAKARRLFDVKFWGQHQTVKYAAHHISPRGSIVLFSGWISRKPMIEMSTLAAIDGAIEALARTLALELAPVRVNAIVPGHIDTPLWRSRLSEDQARAHFDRIAASHPVGRAGTAEDIAHAVLFLIENGFMTGTLLDIDGGWH